MGIMAIKRKVPLSDGGSLPNVPTSSRPPRKLSISSEKIATGICQACFNDEGEYWAVIDEKMRQGNKILIKDLLRNILRALDIAPKDSKK